MPNPLGIKTGPVAQGFKIGQPDGKQLAAFFLFLRLAGFAECEENAIALGVSMPMRILVSP
jgi:hypothetical protein